MRGHLIEEHYDECDDCGNLLLKDALKEKPYKGLLRKEALERIHSDWHEEDKKDYTHWMGQPKESRSGIVPLLHTHDAKGEMIERPFEELGL